ncbi:MAG TPA: ribosome maturation factor RimM [Bacillota bacterium]
MDEPWVAIAEVVAPHGVRGEVRARPLGSHPERFRPGVRVRVSHREGPTLEIRSARPSRGDVLLRFVGIDDRNQAERLRRTRLLVPRSERFPLPEHSYYVDDLRGLPVLTKDGWTIGKLKDVLPNPAHDLFVVALAGGGEVLIPAVRALVHVDLREGCIRVDPPPGLLPEEAAHAH